MESLIAKCEMLAKQIREDCVLMTNRGKSGHVGSMLSMADLVAVLYEAVLNVDPQNPRMQNRDRFILSKGHAGAAIYAALAAKGFFPRDWLLTYYQDAGKLSGHISHHVPGVEFSTGSLGHGLPVAAGLAIAAKSANKAYRVFCMLSDGDLNEGSTWEAIMFASQHQLDNLIAIVDYNRIQSLGPSAEILSMEPIKEKLEAFNWECKLIDGHDLGEILKTFRLLPFHKCRPSIVIAKTVKAKGIPRIENTVASHYRYIPDPELESTIQSIRGDSL